MSDPEEEICSPDKNTYVTVCVYVNIEPLPYYRSHLFDPVPDSVSHLVLRTCVPRMCCVHKDRSPSFSAPGYIVSLVYTER